MESKDVIKNYFRGKYDQFYARYLETDLKRLGQKNEYRTNCPFHKDDTPSFDINAETGLYFCHGCPAKGHAFDFYAKTKELDIRRDFPKILKGIAEDFSITLNETQSRFVEAYDYTDETGNLLFQVCRYEPKSFRQRRKDAGGKWDYNLNGVRRVLYNLPEVIKAQEVYVVEGERDVETLRSMGFTATTSSCGACKWKKEYSESLRDKDVILIPDNDQPGREHMELIASELQGIAKSIKWIDLPDLPDKGDVSDWAKQFSTKEEAAERLSIISADTEEYTPQKEKPQQEESPSDSNADDPNKDIVEKFNAKHAVVMIGGKLAILREIYNPVFDRSDIELLGRDDFRQFYKNRTRTIMIDKKEKEISEADIWLNSPLRRQYDRLVFIPGKEEIPGAFNLWRGFCVQPRKGDWTLMREHIRDVIANGNPQIYDYILPWMARIVQDPGGERPGVVIVLRGKQGTGKGCFATQFGKIFGNHFRYVTQPELITGRFNGHHNGSVLVFIDEGFWTGNKRAEGVLKGLVTENEILCEMKGRDAFPIKNHMNFIIASNSDWVIPAGFEERRFFTIDVSDKHMKDRMYFSAIYNQMSNGGLDAMLYDLMNMDISNVDLRNFPRTEALLDQITHTMNPVEQFWYQGLKLGQFDDSGDWPLKIPCSELYSKFLESSKGERVRVPDSTFGKMIKNLCPTSERKRLTSGIKRTWHYIIPAIEECRECFESKIGMKVNWNDN